MLAETVQQGVAFQRADRTWHETERAALGVAADREALARVDDAPSEVDDARKRRPRSGTRKYGSEKRSPRARAMLM